MRVADAARAGLWLAGSLRSQWRDPAWLAEHQLDALRAQLAHAASTVPFYRKRWADSGFDPTALARREDLAGDRGRWKSSRTSGSTGRPLQSWFDADAWAQAKLALKLRRLLASGWRPGQTLVVVEALDRESIAGHARLHALPGERWLGATCRCSKLRSPTWRATSPGDPRGSTRRPPTWPRWAATGARRSAATSRCAR
jgi:hypothetical protein